MVLCTRYRGTAWHSWHKEEYGLVAAGPASRLAASVSRGEGRGAPSARITFVVAAKGYAHAGTTQLSITRPHIHNRR